MEVKEFVLVNETGFLVKMDAKVKDDGTVSFEGLPDFKSFEEEYKNRKHPEVKFSSNAFDEMRFWPVRYDVTEQLVFAHKPVSEKTIQIISAYFAKLMYFEAMDAEEPGCGDETGDAGELGIREENRFHVDVTLTVNGEKSYTTDDPMEVLQGLVYDLPEADGFTIKAKRGGRSVSPWNEPDADWDWSELAEAIGTEEKFTYRVCAYTDSCGEGSCLKYENGRWIEHTALYSDAVVDRDFGKDWDTNAVNLGVRFDDDRHAEILEQLKDAARRYLPVNEVEYHETAWKEPEDYIDDPEKPCFFLMDLFWQPRKLSEIRDFLDELNRIVEPVKDDVADMGADGYMYQDGEAAFAVAEWKYSPERGFFIEGVEL